MKPLSYGMLFLSWGCAQAVAMAAQLWAQHSNGVWLSWTLLCVLAVLAGLTISHRRAGPAGRGASAAMIACLAVGLLAFITRGTSAFPFFAIMMLLGRNFTLSSRRDLYFNLAICVALFTEPLSNPAGAGIWIFGLLFLVAMVAVLVADYADQRIAHSLPGEAVRVPRELMTAGNLAFVSLLVVAVGLLLFTFLPQPRPFDIMAWRDLRSTYTHIGPGQERGKAFQAGPSNRGAARPGDGPPGDGRSMRGGSGSGQVGGEADGEADASSSDKDRLFEVVSDRQLYLRTATRDRYEQGQWRESEAPATALKGAYRFTLPGGERREMVPYGIEIFQEMSAAIPTALRPQFIRTDTQELRVGPDGIVSLPEPLQPGRVIYAESVMSYSGQRPASDPMPLVGYEAMRALPPEMERELVARARQLGLGRTTGLRRAEAMESHLKSGFRVDPAATSEDPIELLSRRAGPPRAYASTLALLMRADGIPARVAEGYRVRRFDPFLQRYVVVKQDAHVWVEAYLDSRWVVFEPLPGAPLPGPDRAQSLFETLKDRMEIWLEDIRAEQAALRDDEWLKRLLLQALEWLVLALLALLRYGPWAVLAAIAAYFLMRRLGKSIAGLTDWVDRFRLWRHRADEPGRRVLLAFELAERACRRRGLPRSRTENHAEYVAAVASRFPHLEVPISLIGRLFGEARYGDRQVAEEAAQQARAAYLELLSYIDLRAAVSSAA